MGFVISGVVPLHTNLLTGFIDYRDFAVKNADVCSKNKTLLSTHFKKP